MTSAPAVSPPQFNDVFDELSSERGLSAATTRAVFDAIFGGAWTAAQIAGLLVALRQRGETSEVVAAAAGAMRAAMVQVPHDFPALLDTCGTGGDGSGSLNLSTGAALVVAAAGVRVAKHGNRAGNEPIGQRGRAGSARHSSRPPSCGTSWSAWRGGITFLFAQAHHPAMRHAMPARRELGIRTLFNLLGPALEPRQSDASTAGGTRRPLPQAARRSAGAAGC
jgi:anthranilate phosphoribosyltransferase